MAIISPGSGAEYRDQEKAGVVPEHRSDLLVTNCATAGDVRAARQRETTRDIQASLGGRERRRQRSAVSIC